MSGEQGDLDLGLEPAASSSSRRKRRRRGSVEVLSSGAVRVRIRAIKLPDGRRVELSKTITEGPDVAWRKVEALRKVRPALERQALDLEMGLQAYDSGTTLADLVQRLRAGRHMKWKPKDDPCWARLRPLWQVPLASIDDSRISGLMRKLEGDGYAAGYLRSVYGLLRRLLGLAVARGYLGRVPAIRRGTVPSEVSTRRRAAALDDSQKRALFEAARVLDAGGGDLAVRLAFQLDTGLRPIECAWARIDDLREEGGTWWLYPRRAKGSGLRDGQGVDRLSIGEALARDVLRRLDALPPRARALGLLFPHALPRGLYRPRWEEERGQRSAPTWITAAEVRALRARSGVQFFPYSLRHTRMHELARAGASPWQLQQFGAWQAPRMVSVYAGRVKDVHPAMLEPSAPLPGVSPFRVISAQPSEAAKGAGSVGGSGVHVPSVGASAGAAGHGREVGAELDRAWAELSPEDRAGLVSSAARILDAAAEWPRPAAAVAAWVRTRGLLACREAWEALRTIDRAGAMVGREGELRGVVVALEARCSPRGVKRALDAAKKASNPRRVGAAGGSRFTVISGRGSDGGEAPGNRDDS